VESNASLKRKFQGFCDIFNDFRAMAILQILFCMYLDRGDFFIIIIFAAPL